VGELKAGPYDISLKKEAVYFGAAGILGVSGFVNDRGKDLSTVSDLENLNPGDIPSFDRPYAGKWNVRAKKQSDLFLGAGILLPASLFYMAGSDFKPLFVLYAETLALTNGGALFAKGSSSRRRPFAYSDRAPIEESLSRDSKRSFFSGHAANITAGLIFSAKVYSDYNPDSVYTPYLWSVAIAGALIGSSLRVEAGWHFPSDVAAGFMWGGIVGYSVPHFHKRTKNTLAVPFTGKNQLGVLFVTRY